MRRALGGQESGHTRRRSRVATHVDVPIATYGVMGKGKTTATNRLCLLAGTEVPLPAATLQKLYASKTTYTERVGQRLTQLIAEGWFLPEYADMVRSDVTATSFPGR